MFLTDRERQILQILLDAPQGVHVENLIEILGVSRRTVYRELSSLENTLSPLHVSLMKERGSGYHLQAETEVIAALKNQLHNIGFTEMTVQERHRALSLTLLLSDESMTMEQIAQELGVSIGTIQNDLELVVGELERFDVYIDRVKFQGIYVEASERQRRELAGRLIYGSVSDYDFFKYLTVLEDDLSVISQDYFLKLLSQEVLHYTNQAIKQAQSKTFEKVTDNQLQHVMIIIALSVERLRAGHPIGQVIAAKAIESDFVYLAHEILGVLSAELSIAIDINERHFIAMQLEGLNYKSSQSIFFESFDSQLTYQVKELIRLVSEATGNDFRHDDTLFYDLVAHIQATLKRPMMMDYKLDTPVLQRINKEYPNLSSALNRAWQAIFRTHALTNDEKAYIVIHFASSLERHPMIQRKVNAVVISSSGVGTAKILESRLKRHLPEINTVRVLPLSRLSQVDFSNYQLILSTLYLSGMSLPYRVISPLLSDEEIDAIRQDILNLNMDKDTLHGDSFSDKAISFDAYYRYMIEAKQLLDHFRIQEIHQTEGLEASLYEVIHHLSGQVIADVGKVTEAVIRRYQKTPMGIPGSRIGLFHSANEQVRRPYFGVYQLARPYPLTGMDGKAMTLERILLMLAPQQMNLQQQELLGIISSSIIESDVNTDIYEWGTQEDIYQLISSLFIKELQHLH